MDSFRFTNTLPSNFPEKPRTRSPGITSFPEDLMTDKRNFYTQIQFVEYTSIVGTIGSNMFSTGSGVLSQPTGGMALPLPRKLDDQNLVTWDPHSATSQAASILQSGRSALGGASSIMALGGASALSAAIGVSVNPYLYMTFKQPNFKNFNFTWTFAPTTENESNILKNIIDQFKFNMLPRAIFGSALLDYPSIALIKFYPKKEFLFSIRPCIIEAVSVDFTASGGPSFFKNGAPTVVNLSVRFKEIEIWTKNNYVR